MTLIGLDFDNTLVCYDKLFFKTALEKGLIDKSIAPNKIAVRDYLRSKGKDEEFTLLQGEVYGVRILEAEPANGMLQALKELYKLGIPMVLISHKTKTPYKGPKYDLHKSAINWLNKYGFFSKDGLNWKTDQVFFESTKTDKIERIKELGCTHYIDDLEEILEALPKSIKKIHYTPQAINKSKNREIESMTDWNVAQIATSK